MDKEKMINVFDENIYLFNKKGVSFIKHGAFDKAIEIYKCKIDYIRYSYEFDIISLPRAMTMMDDTKRLIDILS